MKRSGKKSGRVRHCKCWLCDKAYSTRKFKQRRDALKGT